MTKEALEKEAIKYDADHLCGARGARWYHNVTIREAYLAGAEPREKRIADLEWQLQEVAKDNDIYQAENKRLEKENAELKDKLNNLASVAEVRLANWQKYEKENAELKDKLENIRRYLDNEIPHELINEATTIIYKMV